jgi:hypothetical protein
MSILSSNANKSGSKSKGKVAKIEDGFADYMSRGYSIISCNIYPDDRKSGSESKGVVGSHRADTYLTTEHGRFSWAAKSDKPCLFYQGLATPFFLWDGSKWVEPTAIVKDDSGAARVSPTSKPSGLTAYWFTLAKQLIADARVSAEAAGDAEMLSEISEAEAGLTLSMVANQVVSFDLKGVSLKDVEAMRRHLLKSDKPLRAVFAVRLEVPENEEDFQLLFRGVEVLSWEEEPMVLPRAGRLLLTTGHFQVLQSLIDEEYTPEKLGVVQEATLGKGALSFATRGGSKRTSRRNAQRAKYKAGGAGNPTANTSSDGSGDPPVSDVIVSEGDTMIDTLELLGEDDVL